MRQKIGLSLIAVIFIFGNTSAQELSRSQTNACNAHIEYINKADKVLYDLIPQLKDLYGIIQNQKKGNSYGAPYRFNFRAEVPEYYLQQAQKERNRLGPLNQATFTNAFDNCANNLKSIVQDCRDIEIYLKLKDYEFDNYAYADSLLKAIRLKFDKHSESNAALSDFLTEYVLKNYYSSGNSSLMAAQAMLKRMQYEQQLLKKLKFNLDERTPTCNIPFDALAQSYRYHFENELPDYSQLKHPLSFYYRQFKGSQLFSGKAYMQDNATRKALQNDGHANYVARNSINFYNHDLIMSYNRFAESLPAEGLYIPSMPRLTPTFKIDSTARDCPPLAYFGKYEANPNLKPPVLKTEQHLSPKQVQSYNACTDFLNQEIRRANQFAEMLTRRNAAINRFTEGNSRYGPGSFSDLSDFGFAHSEFYKALAMSKYLEPEQADYLKAILIQMQILAGEREQIMADLYAASKDRTYQTDNGKSEYKIFKRAEYLYDEFLSLKKDYRIFIQQAALPGEKAGTGPWYESARSLKKPVADGRKLIYILEAKADSSQIPFPSTDEIRSSSRSSLSAFYDNMQGLDKFGRYHGLCPYSPYEDICTESSELAAKIHALTQDSAKAAKFADNLYSYIRAYNDIADEYNRFVRLAEGGYEEFRSHNTPPAFLLKTPKHPYSFRFVPPDNISLPEDNSTNPINLTLEGFAENNLVLLPDVSSSMNDSLKWPLLKTTLKGLLQIMRPEDYVSVVSFAGRAKVVLQPTSCAEKAFIINTISDIQPGGSTSVNKGVELALKTAESGYLPEGNNRIILATDGQFNLSNKSLKQIAKSSDKIHFSVFLFSDNPAVQTRGREIAEKGKGNFYIIHSNSLEKVLLEELQAIQKKESE